MSTPDPAGGGRPGASVATTHEVEADDELLGVLAEGGVSVLLWTAVRTARPDDEAPLNRAAMELDRFDWLAITSHRAVPPLSTRRRDLPSRLRVAVVGARTARAAEEAGWPVSLVSPGPGAEALGRTLASRLDGSESVLLALSDRAGHELETALEGRVSLLWRVTTYRTVPAPFDSVGAAASLRREDVDAVTFMSPSAVEAVVARVSEVGALDLLLRVPAACVGPSTGRAAETAGFQHVEISADPSKRAMAHAARRLAVERRRERPTSPVSGA